MDFYSGGVSVTLVGNAVKTSLYYQKTYFAITNYWEDICAITDSALGFIKAGCLQYLQDGQKLLDHQRLAAQ